MRGLLSSLRKLEPRWPFFALLYAGLVAVHLIDLHMYLRGSPDFRRWHPWHDDIIHGRGFYPDQYRPLTYWLAELVYRVWLHLGWPHPVTTFEYSHLFVRFLFLLPAFLLLHLYLRRWFSSPACAAGTIFVAAVLPLTIIRCSTCVTDPLNFLVFVAGFWLIRDGKAALLPPLVFIGMLNREVAGLLLVAYVLVNWGRPVREWAPTALAMLGAAAAAWFGLRASYGPRKNWAPTWPGHYFGANFLEWQTWELILLFLGAWVFWAFARLRSKPVFLRRCLAMLPLYFAAHAVSGYIREVRYWLPLFPVILPLAMWSIWEPDAEGEK